MRGDRDRERRGHGLGPAHLETHAQGRPQEGQHLLTTDPTTGSCPLGSGCRVGDKTHQEVPGRCWAHRNLDD